MLEFILAACLGAVAHFSVVFLWRRRREPPTSTTSEAAATRIRRRAELFFVAFSLILLAILLLSIFLNPVSFLSPSTNSRLVSAFFGLLFGLALTGYLTQSEYLRTIHISRHNHLIMGAFLLFVSLAGLLHQPLLKMTVQIDQLSLLGVDVKFKPTPKGDVAPQFPPVEDHASPSTQAFYLLSQVPFIWERDIGYVAITNPESDDDNGINLSLPPPLPETIKLALSCLKLLQEQGIVSPELGIDVGQVLAAHRVWDRNPRDRTEGINLAYDEVRTALLNRARQYSIEEHGCNGNDADDSTTSVGSDSSTQQDENPSSLHMNLLWAYWLTLTEDPISGAYRIDEWMQKNKDSAPLWLRIRAGVELANLLKFGGRVEAAREVVAEVLRGYREMFGVIHPRANVARLIGECHTLLREQDVRRLAFSYLNETNNHVVYSILSNDVDLELLAAARILGDVNFECFPFLGDAQHYYRGSFLLTLSELIYQILSADSVTQKLDSKRSTALHHRAYNAAEAAIRAFAQAQNPSLDMWRHIPSLAIAEHMEYIRVRSRYVEGLKARLEQSSGG